MLLSQCLLHLPQLLDMEQKTLPTHCPACHKALAKLTVQLCRMEDCTIGTTYCPAVVMNLLFAVHVQELLE